LRRARFPGAPLGHRRRRQEVIGLVAWHLGVGEATGGDEVGQNFKLVDQLSIEFAPALVVRESAVPVGGLVQRIPSDQHRSGLLGLIEAQQEIGEAKNRAATPVATPSDGLGQPVIGAMRKRVAVDDEEWPSHVAPIANQVGVGSTAQGMPDS